MLGVLVNVVAIIVGGTIGVLLKNKIRQDVVKVVMQAIGLSVIIIGVLGAIKTENVLVLVLSLVSGGMIGALLRIDNRIENLGVMVEEKLSHKEGFAKGFVTGTLIYTVGAMSIVGSLEAGISGDYSILFVKSILDGVTAIVFGATLGYGVIFSFIPVLIFQGSIALLGDWIEPFLTPALENEIDAVGGVLIMAIGFSILEIKKFKLGDLLPSMFMPIFWLFITIMIGV